MLKLKSLRLESEKTQSQVASALSISRQVYANYENEINLPDPYMLIKLADFFGCTTDYLLGREDDFGVVAGNAGNASNAPALTQEETQLLKDFRLLNDISKYKVIGYCHALI